MSYVGNMYSHLPVSVSKLNTMQCIVDVFTSGWINGKDWDMTQISSAGLKLNLVVCRWKTRKDLYPNQCSSNESEETGNKQTNWIR